MKNLYTNKKGLEKFKKGEQFWGWIQEESHSSDYRVRVPEGKYEDTKDGYYLITKLEGVKISKWGVSI